MTTPDVKSPRPPLALIVLNVAGVAWIVAGVGLGGGLWRERSDPSYQADTGLAANGTAVTVMILCGIAAMVCFAATAIVAEIGWRSERTTEVERS